MSDLGLHCLPMSLLRDARYKWVKHSIKCVLIRVIFCLLSEKVCSDCAFNKIEYGIPTFEQCMVIHLGVCPKDAEGMANRVDPDQNADITGSAVHCLLRLIYSIVRTVFLFLHS